MALPKTPLQFVQDLATTRSSDRETTGKIVRRKKGRWYIKLDSDGTEVSKFASELLLHPLDKLFSTATHGGRKRAGGVAC